MQVRLVRHATVILTYKGKKILVDPMLSGAGRLPPIPVTANRRPNPLVPLPLSPAEILDVDACLVTHTHIDHFDGAARKSLPRDKPLFCQPADERRLLRWGFRDVRPAAGEVVWEGIRITRTGGRHAGGLLARVLGPVSGFCLAAAAEPRLYIAGDTLYNLEVEDALQRHQPDAVILYGGGARLLLGGPITMDREDIVRVLRKAPEARVFIVHMEAVNHCSLKRGDLRSFLKEEGLSGRARVLEDGEKVYLEGGDHHVKNSGIS